MLLDGARPWLDPQLTSLHRLGVRPPCTPCPDLRTSRSDDPADSPWWRSLDGTWDFELLDRPEDLRADHLSDASLAGTIEVPGAWTLQGHGHPHYTNVVMPFPGEPPGVPDENPTGVYRREIAVPADWAGRRTVLRVGAAESMVFAYLDGAFVGCGTDSRLPSELDLSAHVAPGRRHHLALVVVKWSASTWVEDQDQWWHGGLQRSVTLHSTAPSHLAGARLLPTLSERPTAPVPADAEVTGRLGIELTFDGPLRAEPGWSAEVLVETLGGRRVTTTGRLPVGLWSSTDTLTELVEAMFVEPGVVRAELDVPRIRPWSAESPTRYRAAVVLRDPSDEVVEVDALRIGFRTVEVRDRELLINGAPVVLRGVNVHEHDPARGRAVPRELAERDLHLVKAANLNAVRAAHYPHDEQFAELCDELGVYLVDEANLESHARQWSLCHDARFGRAFVERVERMARRDAHHPSVVVWSLGNESGMGPAHEAAAAWLRAWDPTRPVQYEGPFMYDLYAEAPVSDIVCPMYTSVAEVQRWSRETGDPRSPLILCEYDHSMGNAGGSLDAYDHLFEEAAGVQGGFIWEWLEHGIALPGHVAPDGRPSWGYGGDFGDEPNDGNFILDGLVDADRVPHPALEEVRHHGRPVRTELVSHGPGRARVGSRSMRWFTDTSDLRADWSLTADGEEVAGGSLGSGGPDGAPLGARRRREVTVRWRAADVPAGAEVHLTVRWSRRRATSWAAAGDEVGHDQFDLGRAGDAPARRSPPVRLEPGAVDVPGLGSFRPTVFRALTDNDGIRTGLLRGLNGSFSRWVDGLGLDRCEWDPTLGELRAPGAAEPLRVRSAVADAGDGRYRLVVELDLPDAMADPPRLGVVWELPGAFSELEWFGDGPHDSYPDRRSSVTAGRWRSTVAEQYVGYGMPQEHGHHTGLRRLSVRDPHGGRGVEVQVLGGDRRRPGFSARHHGDAELWSARHLHDLAPLDGAPVTHLAIDVAQRGLGQGSLGEEPFTEFRIRPGRHRLELLISPLP